MKYMKTKRYTEDEIMTIKARAFRCYNKAREIIEANPKDYDKILVFKLMQQEQNILDMIRVNRRACRLGI